MRHIRYFLAVLAALVFAFYLVLSAIGRDAALIDGYWKVRAEVLRNL
jgi:hypothetical protein